MATIATNSDEEKKRLEDQAKLANPLSADTTVGATPTAPGSPGASSASLAPTTAPVAQQKATASRFVNLNKYIDANKGAAQTTAEAIKSKVGTEASDVASGIAAQAASQKSAADTAASDTVAKAQNVTGAISGGGNVDTATATSLLDSTPSVSREFTPTEGVKSAQDLYSNLGGLQGKYKALNKYFGTDTTKDKLTGAILQQSAPAQQLISDVGSAAASNLGAGLSSAQQLVGSAADTANQNIGTSVEAMKAALGNEIGNLGGMVKSSQEDAAKINAEALARINAGNATTLAAQGQAFNDLKNWQSEQESKYIDKANSPTIVQMLRDYAASSGSGVGDAWMNDILKNTRPADFGTAKAAIRKQIAENAAAKTAEIRKNTANAIGQYNPKEALTAQQAIDARGGQARYNALKQILGNRDILTPEQKALMGYLG